MARPVNIDTIRDWMTRLAQAVGFDQTSTASAADNLQLLFMQAKTADTASSGHTTDIATLTAEVAALEAAIEGDEANTQGIRDTADLALALATTGGVSGSTTPPGGTPGQVQFNNAGSFGGFTLSGDATLNTSTGAITVAQAAKLTTARNIAITGDLAWNVTFDGSAAVTAAGTLATVNSNVGSFGSGTSVASFTVNAKGLITAASNVAITSAPKWTTARTLSFTGDVTGTGSVDGSADVATALTIGALKIATGMIQAGAVTLAKIANAAASSKLLGSGSSGSGSAYAEITLGTNLSMSGTTLSAAGVVAGAGGLIGVQTITATGSGTYTPTSGTTFVIIELQGAGGGSSGISSPGASKFSGGRSGGGGAWLRKKLTTAFSGASYSVGAKGTGGASGDNSGNTGGNTTFTDTAGSPTTYTAGGGVGGANGSSGQTGINYLPGTGGGTATNGDVNRDGGSSQPGGFFTLTQGYAGRGGESMYSSGAPGASIFAANATSTAFNSTGKGGGGGAPVATGTGSAQVGGNGSDGMIIIWEFS